MNTLGSILALLVLFELVTGIGRAYLESRFGF